MKLIIRIGLLSLLLVQSAWSQDTFSIVAVDPATGEVGSAGATCVEGIGSLGGVILLSGIIPGRGGINAQAYICVNPHINLDNGVARLSEGNTPQEVIDWLVANDACFSQNFNPEYRQYGVAALNAMGEPEVAAFTGQNADDWKGHLLGANYAIQGNILLGPEVLEGMEAGFLNTEGTLAERLMAAMQGANIPGADARCLDAGTSSTSAFLRVFKPDDDPDNPWLELNVAEAPAGVEPIDSLQALFDAWLLTSDEEVTDTYEFSVFPNPTQSVVEVFISGAEQEALSIAWYNTAGQQLGQLPVQAGRNTVRLPEQAGVYWICLHSPQGQVLTQEKVMVR
ncbi:DUF1028 domain-containing protein [Phaeodactylibacter sp.]|uniref:DUF1028 domain-containing protein n=1 Tax=Phaeodactylibacter sp. TaxID=1940289 RepID=UPI0025F1173A|nr:DUF1028 domain-containing protein [Phaeodactylibacter sp.]MCI4650342.1 DUF1028 domain-containing protein [Phaeodactylibacter sp.]MCI5094485.1 DUF1028 domain-containing protein [Phaeodactylibacter sp.]